MTLNKTLSLCALILGLTSLTPLTAQAERTTMCSPTKECKIPDFLSMVLADSRYSDVVKGLNSQLGPEDYLMIKSASQLHLDGTVYVYLNVIKNRRFFPPTNKVIGQIVAETYMAPGSGPFVRAVYFKPSADIPGGISVGNQ